MSSKLHGFRVVALVISGIAAAPVACAERTDDASSSAAAQTQVDGGAL
jgi:hypothetical protein